jgi:hypothetical protein
MKFWDRFKEKCALEYLEAIVVLDKADRERCRYKLDIEGERVDTLLGPKSTPIPFCDTKYLIGLSDAEKLGKKEVKKGNKVEIWKLIHRWV